MVCGVPSDMSITCRGEAFTERKEALPSRAQLLLGLDGQKSSTWKRAPGSIGAGYDVQHRKRNGSSKGQVSDKITFLVKP